MKKNLIIFTLVSITTLLSGCTLVDKERAGIQIKSDTSATVFLNSESKGTTPLTIEDLTPGEYEVKLQNDQGSWNKSIRIENGTLFYINYNVAATEDQQEGEMIYLESGRGVGVISTPGNAEVTLDGEKQGFTPYLIQNLTDGDHELVLAKDGFKSRAIKLNAVKDHKIMVEAKLKSLTANSSIDTTPVVSATPNASANSTPGASMKATSTPKATASTTTKASPIPSASSKVTASATPQATKSSSSSNADVKGTVTVLDTSTGWLRVRDKAGLEGQEIGKIDTGETVDYVEQTDNGWTAIIMKDGQKGYVASRFVKVNK